MIPKRLFKLPEGLMCKCGKKAMYSSGKCSRCYTSDWQKSKIGKEWSKKYNSDRTVEMRREVYAAYGGKCFCCGEEEEYFLTIDHVKNDGHKKRKEHGSGSRLYGWIIKNNFPKDALQILCMNCNLGKYRCSGVCPHTFKRE